MRAFVIEPVPDGTRTRARGIEEVGIVGSTGVGEAVPVTT
jgi:hypothetical protein